MRDGAKGTFGVGPPACIPNNSPSQVRFDESTPLSHPATYFVKVPESVTLAH
jgi:hypothetical protein